MTRLECSKVHVIGCDLDNTLVAAQSNSQELLEVSDEALREIGRFVTGLQVQGMPVYFGSSTGRTFTSIQELAQERPAFGEIFQAMDFHIASVGSAIYARQNNGARFTRAASWPSIASWDREALNARLSLHPDLSLQELTAQDIHKISYTTTSRMKNTAHATELHSYLGTADLQANAIVSGGGSWRFVDILPTGVDKGSALLQLPRLLEDGSAIPESSICRIAVGDSMNDQAALAAADVAIIPGNGQPDLLDWIAESQPTGSFYITDGYFAAGALQGLRQHLCPA
jgi:HAD superfamily hydrolase (TIGR01484 family)